MFVCNNLTSTQSSMTDFPPPREDCNSDCQSHQHRTHRKILSHQHPYIPCCFSPHRSLLLVNVRLISNSSLRISVSQAHFWCFLFFRGTESTEQWIWLGLDYLEVSWYLSHWWLNSYKGCLFLWPWSQGGERCVIKVSVASSSYVFT